MKRTVRVANGHTWTVHSRISWTKPERAAQFEHDMTAGYVSGVAMVGVVLALTLFVVFWTPVGVVIPAWFVLLVLLVLLLVPVWWAWQRPWIITACTDEPIATERDHWEIIVYGVLPSRQEAQQIVNDLKTRGVLDHDTGRLSRITSSTAPFHDL
ncbi:MAG: hypothetical protein ACRDQ4_23435 [Pseudonocardiaceae bacterium]